MSLFRLHYHVKEAGAGVWPAEIEAENVEEAVALLVDDAPGAEVRSAYEWNGSKWVRLSVLEQMVDPPEEESG